ncbi:MAG: hypothetical protein ACOC53_00320 [Candidatus Saliniplasma sp.]
MKRSNRGTMELPFKLMMMMLLIGMVIPTTLIGYRNVNRTMYENRVMNELHDLIAFSRKLKREGDLSSMTIELDLTGDTFASLEYLHIGDSLDKRPWMLNYRLSWKESDGYLSAVDPLVKLTSPNNNTFRLTSGSHRLKLTHIYTEDTSFIVVSNVNQVIDGSRFT